MSCVYEYYNDENEYFPRLYCSINNGYCIYSKKCLKVNKFIPLDNQGECYRMIGEKIKQIPKDSYYVETFRPNRFGKLYLYVVIEDKIEKILSDFEELKQEYVYLKKGTKGYSVSLTPFPKVEKEKRTYTKKTKKDEE